MTDFHFSVHMDGKITFEIHYEEGALLEVFPEARTGKFDLVLTKSNFTLWQKYRGDNTGAARAE